MGEESELRVVIGDLCPVPEVLALLRAFFDRHPGTRLHLHVEALAGPWERLFDGEADLIIHHIDKADPRLEFIDLCAVKLIPVVAPGFLRMPISEEITPEQMRGYVQCVIRDTARHSTQPSFYIIEGAQSWTVADQLMKKEIIVQGAAWGHLHDFLIEQELRDWPRLTDKNMHPFRLKVKELRYVLRLGQNSDSKLIAELGDVKDQIGLWHDWNELAAISSRVLEHGAGCPIATQIRSRTKEELKKALESANALRAHYLPSDSGRRPRRKGVVTEIHPALLKATSRLAS